MIKISNILEGRHQVIIYAIAIILFSARSRRGYTVGVSACSAQKAPSIFIRSRKSCQSTGLVM